MYVLDCRGWINPFTAINCQGSTAATFQQGSYDRNPTKEKKNTQNSSIKYAKCLDIYSLLDSVIWKYTNKYLNEDYI